MMDSTGKMNAVWKKIKKDRAYYIMLILPIAYFILFKYVPMAGNIIAFRRFKVGGSIWGSEWVGLKYFKMFFYDKSFWNIFKNTLVLSIYSIVVSFPIPIVFALLLNEVKSTLLKKVTQTVSYLPYFISIIVIVGMMTQLLSPTSGVVNTVLMKLKIIKEPITFMASPEYFKTLYVFSGVWQNMGWNAIIYIAALAGVDPQLCEACVIDGANRWQRMRAVTIPTIMPTIVITLILAIGQMIGIGFEKVLAMQNMSNLSSSEVVSTYVYRIGLGENNYSLATAIGLFESLISLVLLTIANTTSKKVTGESLW